MAIALPNKAAGEICEALGLKMVVDLDIAFHLNEIATVTVKYYPEQQAIEKMATVLKKYKIGLTEIKE